MKRAIIIALFLLALASCTPDPRREADAYATRQQADSLSASQEQARQQDADLHEIKVKQLVDAGQWFSTLMMTSLVASMFTIFIALTSLGIGLAFVFIGGGIAIAKRNMTMPNRIRLDPVTRQYPILPIYLGDGRYAIGNINDGEVMMLDTSKPADALKVKAAFAINHDGSLAYQARLSHKPGDVAQIQAPQILEAE